MFDWFGKRRRKNQKEACLADIDRYYHISEQDLNIRFSMRCTGSISYSLRDGCPAEEEKKKKAKRNRLGWAQ